MSTLAVNTLQAQTGTTVSVSSGQTLYAPGHVVQVVSAVKSDTMTISGAYADVLSCAITPKFNTSKIQVQVLLNASHTHRYSGCKLFRGSTQIALGDADSGGFVSRVFMSIDANQDENTNAYVLRTMAGIFVDSPSTTSATTYKIQCGLDDGSSTVTSINKQTHALTGNYSLRGITTITLMEIAQ